MASVFWIWAVWLLNVLIGVININTTGQLIAYYHWLSLIPAILLAFIPRTPSYPAGELNRSLTQLIGHTVKVWRPWAANISSLFCNCLFVNSLNLYGSARFLCTCCPRLGSPSTTCKEKYKFISAIYIWSYGGGGLTNPYKSCLFATGVQYKNEDILKPMKCVMNTCNIHRMSFKWTWHDRKFEMVTQL